MDRFEILKEIAPMDWLILAMLYHGLGVTDIATKLGVSRQTVYRAPNNVEQLLLKLNLLDITVKPE